MWLLFGEILVLVATAFGVGALLAAALVRIVLPPVPTPEPPADEGVSP